MNRQFNVTQQPDGSLVPHPQGEGLASLVIQKDPVNGMTGTLVFAGANQAVLTYDALGQRVIAYFPYNIMNTKSIENIVAWLNGQTVH